MNTSIEQPLTTDSVAAWKNAVEKLIATNELESLVRNAPDFVQQHKPSTLELDDGRLFIRVWKQGHGILGGSRSAFAFIAKQDGQSKAMGTYKRGDIFKPATWKAPAKHARGNLFDAHQGLEFVGPYGMAYLR